MQTLQHAKVSSMSKRREKEKLNVDNKGTRQIAQFAEVVEMRIQKLPPLINLKVMLGRA